MTTLPHTATANENKDPGQSSASRDISASGFLDRFKCWSSPCKKLALYKDNSGWCWCQEHFDRNVEQGEGSILHEVDAIMDYQFFVDRLQPQLDLFASDIRRQALEEAQQVIRYHDAHQAPCTLCCEAMLREIEALSARDISTTT